MGEAGMSTRCPSCGSAQSLRIEYGLVLPSADEGVVLGGCKVGPDSPTRECSACGERFGRPSETPERDVPLSGATRELDLRDTLMAKLITRCGLGIAKHPERTSFLEALIEDALCQHVGECLPGTTGTVTGRKGREFPNWRGRLKDVDVKLRLPGEPDPSILIEAKVDAVGQTMWDLLKLAEVPFLQGAVAGYLVVAATKKTWSGSGDCVPLFATEPGEVTWETATFFEMWPNAWAELKAGGSGRPKTAPEHVQIRFIHATDVVAFPGHELRCVRVLPLGSSALKFHDGDPVVA